MQRTVTIPADLAGSAVEELKGWLGISRPAEDALLADLLRASLAMCEAFTGQAPIEQTIEETIAPTAGEHAIQTRPVRSFVAAQLIEHNGTRAQLPADAFEFRIDALDKACIALNSAQDGRGVALTLRAGIAENWDTLPEALKQGVIRLAAFHYRERDEGRTTQPPASVTALWRPWRVVRLV